MANNSPITEAQKGYIHSLAAKRAVSDTLAARIALIDVATVAQASSMIDELRMLPYKPRPVGAISKAAQALATIPKSGYAIPFDLIRDSFPEVRSNGNDYLFLEVRERNNVRYMRRLVGAPGAFSRYRLGTETIVGLVNVIAHDPQGYAQKAGELYSRCGCCFAELTDVVSRALNMGPECRLRYPAIADIKTVSDLEARGIVYSH